MADIRWGALQLTTHARRYRKDDDDGDEDFEPPAAEEEEEGEEAGVRRRNIQARELSDLLQDACKQLGPLAIPPGLRERVLDQLSMHFQLLVQTAVLSVKESSREEGERAMGMLEHLAFASCEENHRRRTRARGTSSMWVDPLGDGLPSVSVPGLLPRSTLKCDVNEAGDSQRTVEQLMVSRGGVVWPQLLPRKTCGDINSRGSASTRTQTAGSQAISGSPHHSCPVLPLVRPDNFSMVEDRLLCRGVHLYRMDWESIKGNVLPHKSTQVLMHRYAILSGWASKHSTERRASAQGGLRPWTLDEDWKLRNAVQIFGRKWARISREVIPYRGRESLRNRWAYLQEIRANVHGLTDAVEGGMGVRQSLATSQGSLGSAPEEHAERIVERSIASSRGTSPKHTSEKRNIGSLLPKPQSNDLGATDGIKFAEDELSDDPDNCRFGSAVARQKTSTDGSTLRFRRTPARDRCQGRVDPEHGLSGKRLFDEDELSDDECSSVRGGAAVLRRTRGLGIKAA